MSVIETPRGFVVDWRDEHGRRRRKLVPTREGALHIERIIRQQVNRARAALSDSRLQPDLDLQTAAQLFLSSRPTANSTRALLRWRLQNLTQHVGNIPITQVTPLLLDAWLQARKQKLAPSSLSAECIAVRAFFRYLQDRWQLTQSPAEELPCKRQRTSSGREISHREELIILQAATARARAQYLLGADAGMRRGELTKLRLNQINPEAGEITVIPSKPGQPRIVPMTPRLQKALHEITPPHTHPDLRIFSFHGKEPQRHTARLRSLHPQGTAWYRFHDLRHTFASRLAYIATPLYIIRALLGHAPQTTTDIYLHPSREQAHQAITALAEHNAHNLQQESKRKATLEKASTKEIT
jgi:integrase